MDVECIEIDIMAIQHENKKVENISSSGLIQKLTPKLRAKKNVPSRKYSVPVQPTSYHNDELMELPNKNFKNTTSISPNRRRKLSWTGLRAVAELAIPGASSPLMNNGSPSSRRRKISRAGEKMAEMVRSISSNNVQVN